MESRQQHHHRRPRASSFHGLALGRQLSSSSTLSVVSFCLFLLLLALFDTADAVKLQGGSALALAGKDCVVLAMDQRVGTR